MSIHNETPCKANLNPKKRDASSPLQETSLELKKSKFLTSPLTVTKTGQDNPAMPATGSEPVLTEQDLDNIVARMQKVFVPLVSKMIDSSLDTLKKEYNEKIDNQKQLISDLSEENDDLRSDISSLRTEVERLKARDDEQEQYSRRNSIRISGIKEDDKRPTSEIVLEIARENDIEITASDIDRSHRVGERKAGSHRLLLVKFTSYRARKAFMKKKKDLSNDLYFNEDLTKKRDELLFQARRRRNADKLNGAWSYDGRVYIRDVLDDIKEVKSEIDIDTAIFETEKKINDDPDKYRSTLLKRKSRLKTHMTISNAEPAVVPMT